MAKRQFKAESKRLMDLMINSIYTNREIFLREIISNASDAIDKLYYISLTDEEVRKNTGEFKIRVAYDKEARTVTVSDNGIGMTEDEVINNLGTIAKSGSLAFKEENPDKRDIDIIGQFGVGFYSAFMVSDSVTVETKSYKTGEAVKWVSSGADGYTVCGCEKDTYGTSVIMHLKPDTDEANYSEFLEEYTLRRLIKNYSDYIRHPICMEVTKSREVGEGDNKSYESYKEEDVINSMVPIWRKSKKEADDKECAEFYKQKFNAFDDPFCVIRINAEGTVSFKAMLFIPSKAPYDYFTKDYEKGLQLYSSGVLIMDKCSDLLPDHFRFVRGVVDSEDLSLNISRETLQQDAQLKAMASNIEKKIKSELEKKLKNDRENYEKFFDEFGIQLKYGVVADYGMHKDAVEKLLLFRSVSTGKYLTFDEYKENMPKEQKFIYYASGKNVENISALPQAELIRAKNYDILCMTEDVDEFVVSALGKVGDTELKNINDAGEELDSETEKKIEEAEKNNSELLAFIKETLGENVSKVIISKKLKSHPVCLTTEGQITLEMEKYFASLQGTGPKPKAERVLELNSEHEIFKKLTECFASDREKCADISKILYSQALLIAGLPIDNPAEYSELVCSLVK